MYISLYLLAKVMGLGSGVGEGNLFYTLVSKDFVQVITGHTFKGYIQCNFVTDHDG